MCCPFSKMSMLSLTISTSLIIPISPIMFKYHLWFLQCLLQWTLLSCLLCSIRIPWIPIFDHHLHNHHNPIPTLQIILSKIGSCKKLCVFNSKCICTILHFMVISTRWWWTLHLVESITLWILMVKWVHRVKEVNPILIFLQECHLLQWWVPILKALQVRIYI